MSNDLLAPESTAGAVPEHLAPKGVDLLAPGGAAAAMAELVQQELPLEDAGERWVHPNDLSGPDDHLTVDINDAPTHEPEYEVPGLPFVQRRPVRSSMEDGEGVVEAGVAAFVETEMAKPSDGRHLVMEYGPLRGLESRLRSVVLDQSDPKVAEMLTGQLRRCIHDAVVTNTLLSAKETTEEGLNARIEATNDLADSVEANVEPLLMKLEELRYPNIDLLRTAIKNTIEVEQRRLELMTKSLVPATIGHHIFEGLKDLGSRLAGTFEPEQLVGDARRHRNDQLSRAMTDLREVTEELRANAGDEEWERVNGERAAEMATSLTDSISNLVRGVEDQVDHNTVQKVLNTAGENIQHAADHAADEDHKSRLKRMVEMLKTALEAIAEALKRVFGKDNDDKKDSKAGGPSGPSPARPTH